MSVMTKNMEPSVWIVMREEFDGSVCGLSQNTRYIDQGYKYAQLR
jgi:hypothetical protein